MYAANLTKVGFIAPVVGNPLRPVIESRHQCYARDTLPPLAWLREAASASGMPTMGGSVMIEVPAYPGDDWQPVICRLCTRPFDVLVTDPTAEPIVLCQACALFVEVLGQPARPAPALRPMSSAANQLQRRALPEPTPAAPAAPLSAVWGHWWTRWRESQQEEPAPSSLPSEPGAEASC